MAIAKSSCDVIRSSKGLMKSSLFFRGFFQALVGFKASQTAARAVGLSVRLSTSSKIARAAGSSLDNRSEATSMRLLYALLSRSVVRLIRSCVSISLAGATSPAVGTAS